MPVKAMFNRLHYQGLDGHQQPNTKALKSSTKHTIYMAITTVSLA